MNQINFMDGIKKRKEWPSPPWMATLQDEELVMVREAKAERDRNGDVT
jgi:hypothetical protein